MELSQILTTVWRSWRVVIACCLAAGGIALIVSMSLPRQYSAEARVLVGSLTEPNYEQQLAYQQLAQTYAQLATTTPVLASVRARLGLSDDATRLAQRVDARAPVGQAIVRVAATASTPSGAAGLANAVATEITLMARPAEGQASLAAIIQPAAPPDSPSSPLILLDTLAAAALGTAAGVGLALAPVGWLRAWRRSQEGLRAWSARVTHRTWAALVPVRHKRGVAGSASLAPLASGPNGVVPSSTARGGAAAAPGPGTGGAPSGGSRRRRRTTIGADPLEVTGSETRTAWDSALQDLEAARLERSE